MTEKVNNSSPYPNTHTKRTKLDTIVKNNHLGLKKRPNAKQSKSIYLRKNASPSVKNNRVYSLVRAKTYHHPNSTLVSDNNSVASVGLARIPRALLPYKLNPDSGTGQKTIAGSIVSRK